MTSLVLKTLVLLFSALIFLISLPQLDRRQNKVLSPEMEVALPRLVQVIMAGGDRYLAANLGSIRALVSDTQRMDQDAFRVLGLVQQDVAWLNPAHEDNFYTAAAILPWNGELDAAQYILRRAIDARPFDMWPSFYYAFNIYYFKHDSVTAAEWLRLGATRAIDEGDSLLLNDLASRWVRNSADRQTAISILSAMAKTARSGGFAAYLRKHVVRLENQLAIENAARAYKQRTGDFPTDISTLLHGELVDRSRLTDPFGATYHLDAKGVVSVQETVK